MSMNADKWRRIKGVFNRAVDLGEDERRDYLQFECRNEPDVLTEVLKLLESDETGPSGSSVLFAQADGTPSQAVNGISAKYRVVRSLGSGGMGEVYLAEDRLLRRYVALKVLPRFLARRASFSDRLLREGRAIARLVHPNVVTIFEMSVESDMPYIAMEYVEGNSLRDIMNSKRLALGEAVAVIRCVIAALEAAHEKRVIHRDIKPENIMLTKDEEVKVLDFGIAKFSDDDGLTLPGGIIGTVSYMSPEQANGETIDARSDFFSLGVVAYELLTGQKPFEGETHSEIRRAITRAKPDFAALEQMAIPDPLIKVIAKSLEKKPAKRYQTASEFLAALVCAAESAGITSEEAQPVQSADTTSSRFTKRLNSRLTIVISALLALTLAAFLIQSLFHPDADQTTGTSSPGRLAVLYFKNFDDPTDSMRTAEMITSLLIAELSESDYLRVTSRQRLNDILSRKNLRKNSSLDAALGASIAREVRAQWFLMGDIIQTEPNVVISSQLMDSDTRTVVSMQRISGEPHETVFDVVDKLSKQLREDLSIPANSGSSANRDVASVTTTSPQAYRYYLEGLEHRESHRIVEAEASFNKALEYDSTMAMAYYWLSRENFYDSQMDTMANKAMRYIEGVNQKEQFMILARHARLNSNPSKQLEYYEKAVEADPEDKHLLVILARLYGNREHNLQKSIDYFDRSLELDPEYAQAYNELGYVYLNNGMHDSAVAKFRQYIELRPEEANSYHSMAEAFQFKGDLDSALIYWQKTLEIKPDFYLRANYGILLLFADSLKKADRLFRSVASDKSRARRSVGRYAIPWVSARKGKLRQAIKEMDEGIVGDRLEGYDLSPYQYKFLLKATYLYELGDFEPIPALIDTVASLRDHVNAGPQAGLFDVIPYFLAGSGFYDMAEQIDSRVQQLFDSLDLIHQPWARWQTRGSIEFHKGEYDSAIAHLEIGLGLGGNYVLSFCLAEAYIAAERYEDSADLLERITSVYHWNRAFHMPLAVKAHYLLGIAYEKLGRIEDAKSRYRRFLEIWKDADPELHPLLDDARQRRKRLNQS